MTVITTLKIIFKIIAVHTFCAPFHRDMEQTQTIICFLSILINLLVFVKTETRIAHCLAISKECFGPIHKKTKFLKLF